MAAFSSPERDITPRPRSGRGERASRQGREGEGPSTIMPPSPGSRSALATLSLKGEGITLRQRREGEGLWLLLNIEHTS